MTGIRILRDVVVPLRDAASTAAEIWMPDDGMAHPAILVRTPYLKETAAPTAVVDSRMATERGYAVVLQDVRGRGASDGQFHPFVDEEKDGFDTVTWIAGEPWCNGHVFMAGASYVGATQWLAAVGAPPALRGIAPALSSDDYGDGWCYTGQVPEYGFLMSWCAAELAPLAKRMLDDVTRSWDDAAETEAAAPWLHEWLEHGPESPFWRARSVAHRRAEVRVPAIVIAGWYDIFLSGSLGSFNRSRDQRDRLVLGPWGHSDTLSNLVGIADVGIPGFGLGTVSTWVLDFFDAVAGGNESELPRVRAYVLGARRWVDLPSWPPPGVEELALPLAPGEFEVEPSAPVPTLGGRGLQVHVPGWGFGIADQRPLADRDDVHVALHLMLDRDTLASGPMTAHLAIAPDSNRDEDRLWAVILCVEQPDGALHNLAEGVAGSTRGSDTVDVSLGHTYVWLPAGSTLVALVAGSSFPRWPKPQTTGVQRLLAGSSLALATTPRGLGGLVESLSNNTHEGS